MSDLLRILALAALVAGNAFFVIAEYSIVTARRSGLVARAEEGSAAARRALRLMDDPVRVISATQVGITAIGILIGALGEPLVRDLLGDGIPRWLAFLIAFVVVTYLTVVFGELVPKAVTLARAERVAMAVSGPVELTARLLRPVAWVLSRSAEIVLRPLGIREVVAGDGVRSPEELRALIDQAEGAGVIPAAQEELLHNVFDFARLEARDVMVPAADVVWLDAALVPDAALAVVVARSHSRYPVGDGSLDRLAGVVHLRELVAAVRSAPQDPIRTIARPAHVVPETKDLGALLRDLRERHEQLAVVVDEYGGVAGIVTIEDVLEEIVGEIEDEYDLPDDRLTWVDDRTVLVAGSMSIDDFNEELGTSLPQDGPRTMAGLVFSALGRRPEPGDTVTIGAARLVVEHVDAARITRLRVELPGAEAPGDRRRASAPGA